METKYFELHKKRLQNLIIKSYPGRKNDKGYYVIELRSGNWDNFSGSIFWDSSEIYDEKKQIIFLLQSIYGNKKFRLYLTYTGNGLTSDKMEYTDFTGDRCIWF